jgi:hypothetical protein
VLNKLEGQKQTLTANDIEVLQRVEKKLFPDADYDPYEVGCARRVLNWNRANIRLLHLIANGRMVYIQSRNSTLEQCT